MEATRIHPDVYRLRSLLLPEWGDRLQALQESGTPLNAFPDGAAAVWAVATRITDLDANGYPYSGAPSYVTDALIKATLTPVTATGDDIEVKNAAGNLSVFGKHGDIPKYATVNVELATPDPALEQILAGGTVLADSSAALGTPSGSAATAQTTLGTLATGTYGYRVSQYNSYGESLAQNEFTAAVTGPTGTAVIAGVVMAAGALGARVYGRTQGQEQYIGSIPNIGTQATSGASGTGAGPFNLAVTPLTKAIPSGTKFQIAGDTNTPKITFTSTAFVPVGAVVLPATSSQSVGITIAAGNIIPVLFDTGAVAPNGALPAADTTAGPGAATGYQAPALGTVANPDGVSIEFFEKAIVGGYQAANLPYWHIVVPRVTSMHVMARDVTNANLQNVYEGQAFENPNWGSGPVGDWPFDSTKWVQRARCGSQVLPTVSLANQAAIL